MENDCSLLAAATSEWNLLRYGLLIFWKVSRALGLGPRSPALVSPSCPGFTEGLCITHVLTAHFGIISDMEHGKG